MVQLRFRRKSGAIWEENVNSTSLLIITGTSATASLSTFGGYDPAMNRGGPTLFIAPNGNVWAYANTDAAKTFTTILTFSISETKTGNR
jgi:hypothetical protein